MQAIGNGQDLLNSNLVGLFLHIIESGGLEAHRAYDFCAWLGEDTADVLDERFVQSCFHSFLFKMLNIVIVGNKFR
jgi:hypothetical protein